MKPNMNMGRGGYRRNAGRKAGWRHGETKTIRVPVALREELLEIGKQLDQGEYMCRATYSQLNAILNEWQTKCDAEPIESGEWQKVRQLIGEIQQVLSTQETQIDDSPSEEAFGHRHKRRRGRRFGQFGRGGDFERDFQADNGIKEEINREMEI
ncbi:MAG: hypothetical protein SWZ49_32190 [Cyanobacteriota bacterium]|nr:hypothetical protein [Cyanobacteriota bacterium]